MLQSVSTLSTKDTEYMTLTEAAKEAIWLKDLVNEMGLKQDSMKVNVTVKVLCLAKNQIFHARIKHIEVHYHWI